MSGYTLHMYAPNERMTELARIAVVITDKFKEVEYTSLNDALEIAECDGNTSPLRSIWNTRGRNMRIRNLSYVKTSL